MVGAMSTTLTDGLVPIHIDLAPTNTGLPHFHSLETTLRVTWYKSSRSVWMSYRDNAIAQEAHVRLSAALRAVSLEIELQHHPLTRISTIKLVGLETGISKQDLLTCLTERLQPDEPITFGPHNYDTSISGEDAIRKHLLESSGCEISSELLVKKFSPAKECREFLFEENLDMEGLVQQLHDKPFKELGGCKVYVKPFLVLRLHVKKEAYGAKCQELKPVFEELSAKWQIKHKVEVVRDGILIALCSENRIRLARAKDLVETAFRRPEWTYSPSQKESKQIHRIRLTKDKAQEQAKRVFDQAKDEFGADVITFDEHSDPPAILLKGDSNALRKLQKILRPDKSLPKSKTATCVICLEDDVDDFVKMDSCGHIACTDCMMQYVTMEREGKFPLTCFGEGCKEIVALPKIESLLNKEQMVKLCQEAVADHYRRHPADFGTCPGKGCGKDYRRSREKDRRRTCNNCLICLCARCNVAFHDGVSCKDYRDRINEEERETQRWMEEVGAKKCPRCQTPFEKEADTCNNAKCHVCKVHFCWICLEVCPSHSDVYRHLIEKHGGYFDDEVRQWENILGDMRPEEAHLNGLGADVRAARAGVRVRGERVRVVGADMRAPGDEFRRMQREFDDALRQVNPNIAEGRRQNRRHARRPRHPGFVLPEEWLRGAAEDPLEDPNLLDLFAAALRDDLPLPEFPPQPEQRGQEPGAAVGGAEHVQQWLGNALAAPRPQQGNAPAVQEAPRRLGRGLAIRPVDGPAHNPLPRPVPDWYHPDGAAPLGAPPAHGAGIDFVAQAAQLEEDRARLAQQEALVADGLERPGDPQEPQPAHPGQQQGFVPANDGGIHAEIAFAEDNRPRPRPRQAEHRPFRRGAAQLHPEAPQPAREQQQGFVLAGFHEPRPQAVQPPPARPAEQQDGPEERRAVPRPAREEAEDWENLPPRERFIRQREAGLVPPRIIYPERGDQW